MPQRALTATTKAAGAAMVAMPPRMPAKYIPIMGMDWVPAVLAASKATVASKKLWVSWAVMFRNPTTNPITTRISPTWGIALGMNPFTKATNTPKRNRYEPILLISICFDLQTKLKVGIDGLKVYLRIRFSTNGITAEDEVNGYSG